MVDYGRRVAVLQGFRVLGFPGSAAHRENPRPLSLVLFVFL